MQTYFLLFFHARFETENPCEIYHQNLTPITKAPLASFTYLAPGVGSPQSNGITVPVEGIH